MNEKRFGNVSFYFGNMKHIVGFINSPSGDVLVSGNLVHRNPYKVASRLALPLNFRAQFSGIQARPPETFAPQPDFHQFGSILRLLQSTHAGDQHLVNRQKSPVYGKATCRKQDVIKEIRSRSMTTHDEHRAPASR